jgi:uncharacterized membrane protein YtjA (UPF0391 family)
MNCELREGGHVLSISRCCRPGADSARAFLPRRAARDARTGNRPLLQKLAPGVTDGRHRWPGKPEERVVTLLKWALIFLVISIIAGLLGFTGISAGAADIARFLFYVFVVIFLILLVLGLTIFRV